MEDLREKVVGACAVITSLTVLLVTWCRADSYKREYGDIMTMYDNDRSCCIVTCRADSYQCEYDDTTRRIRYDDELLTHDNKHSLPVTYRVDFCWKYDYRRWQDLFMMTWYDIIWHGDMITCNIYICQRKFKYDIDDIAKYDVTIMKYDVRITN